MAKINKANKELAQRLGRTMPLDWTPEQARDYLNQVTSAELDAFQLDLLVDVALRERSKG